MTADSYFVRVDENRYAPTAHVGGAWADDDLHVSPIAGLLVHHTQRERARTDAAGKPLARLTFDILGKLSGDEIEIHTRTLRPGRTIELLETTASIAGRLAIVLRAWAMSTGDTTAVSGVDWPPLPIPDELPTHPVADTWPGGFIRSLDMRRTRESRPGRAQAWMHSPLDLVAGEEADAVARYVALVDTANGVAVRESPAEWMFPNVDLTIHFLREPEVDPIGTWAGMDTTVAFGETGLGITSTILHDIRGPVGTAQQSLTVRPLGVR